ncbi:hypothetical protein [Pelosinus sp. IPA-1]|uniref:hypothetical protein n=1 Tax=Pelosinus sp. IPA-1 TaxID=3029569 RepID=UPI0024362313|nr:hypothetical protein [Pelosinus sp. IPA-1]GMB01059.1 hypothetical protein PIPA1_38580 [Pelosinus sp. IPA-1]
MAVALMDFKRQDKISADWLLNCQEYRNQYLVEQESYSELSATTYSGMPHGSGIGKPAENKAITLTDLEIKRLWIITIENAESTLSNKKKAFLEFRRRAEIIENAKEVGRPGWVDYVQVRYADWHEKEYGKTCLLSKNTLHSWWNDIVDVTVRIAIKKGCF